MEFKDVIFKYIRIRAGGAGRSFWKAIWHGKTIDTGYNKSSLMKRIKAQCE